MLSCARTLIGARIGAVTRASSLYRSPAWPDPTDPPFVNAVLVIRTSLSPAVTMNRLLDIETVFGRRRRAPNAPRTLDLDLIAWADLRISSRQLTLPHPRAAARNFVMQPFAEIAPAFRLPGDGVSVQTRACRTAPLRRLRRWW